MLRDVESIKVSTAIGTLVMPAMKEFKLKLADQVTAYQELVIFLLSNERICEMIQRAGSSRLADLAGRLNGIVRGYIP